jgi:hypothetical protein
MKPYDDFDMSQTCEEYYGPDYDHTLEELWSMQDEQI